MHQVLTSYEEGVYAVLFSSVPDEDVKPEWIERANARTQRVSQQQKQQQQRWRQHCCVHGVLQPRIYAQCAGCARKHTAW
jgi:hypothetical protein